MYDSVKNKIKPKKKISFICRNDKLFLCHNDIAVIQYMCLQIVIYANYHSHKKKKYTITLKKKSEIVTTRFAATTFLVHFILTMFLMNALW